MSVLYPVSIITVHFQNIEQIKRIWQSLSTFKQVKFEWIIVDNHSSDEIPSDWYLEDRISIIHTGINIGKSEGKNLGAKYASHDLFLFLDEECMISEYSVRNLILELQHEQVGIACPLVAFQNSGKNLEFAGGKSINSITGKRKNQFYSKEFRTFDETHSFPTNFAHESCFMVRKSDFKKVEGWPGEYYLFYGEFEFSNRIRQINKSIHIVPSAFAYHSEKVEENEQNDYKFFWMFRSRLQYIMHQKDRVTAFYSALYHFLVLVPLHIVTAVLRGKPSRVQTIVAVVNGMKKPYQQQSFFQP